MDTTFLTIPKMLLEGATGAGKTTCLRQRYRYLVERGQPTDAILVLVLNATEQSNWRQELVLPASGFLHVYTYFGFVQREIRRFWPWIASRLPAGRNVAEPTFLTVETSQYLMETCIGEMREKGYFYGIRSTTPQISIQLLENLSMAAIARLDPDTIGVRLQAAFPGQQPAGVFREAQETIDLYRRRCLQARLLDYALSLEAYHQWLLPNPAYRRHLERHIRHLIVDDAEETLPAALDFIGEMLKFVDTAAFAFSTDGGHSTFFGAHPELAREVLARHCATVSLAGSHTASFAMFRWGGVLADRITGQGDGRVPGDVVEYLPPTELRGQMIAQVGDRIVRMLGDGVAPGEIVVVAPFIDKVLEYMLASQLKKAGFALENAARKRRLIDQPFAQALVTIAAMTHPDWGITVTAHDIAHGFRLLLNLDAVRSMLLARETIRSPGYVLPELSGSLRGRIGYHKGEQYDLLREQLAALTGSPEPIDRFLQRVFGELLGPLSPSAEDLIACRQLIQSAQRFREFAQALDLFTPDSVGRHFLMMIERGTIAAESLIKKTADARTVYLTTPYAWCMNRGESVRYQFWLDISGEGWWRSDAKELTNPHVLSRRWQPGEVWTDEKNEALKREKAARTVRALARRCREKVFVAQSACDSLGFDREGLLAELIAESLTKRETA